MKTIGDLLSRDLSRKIEEIIQVDQADEQSVHAEITEYVATDSIRDQYAPAPQGHRRGPVRAERERRRLGLGVLRLGQKLVRQEPRLRPPEPHGAGQHVRRPVQAADRRQADQRPARPHQRQDPHRGHPLRGRQGADTRKVTERIAELMYTVLLRELGYAEDFDIAELEIELEAEGSSTEFVRLQGKTTPRLESPSWNRAKPRQLSSSTCRSWTGRSARGQKLPGPAPSCTTSTRRPTPRPTRGALPAEPGRRRSPSARSSSGPSSCGAAAGPGKALVFIIDEVGQHVARSGDKIEDLRATVEEFGKVGKNLLKARKITAPCWIVVTSQEKLDEVVAAIDSKRVELAKLQDRFRHRVDLAPSDIREVATKRVLAKKAGGRAGR